MENKIMKDKQIMKIRNNIIEKLNSPLFMNRYTSKEYPQLEFFCVDDIYELIDDIFLTILKKRRGRLTFLF